MKIISISIVSSDALILDICQIAADKDIRCSEPISIGRSMSVLNSPLGPVEIEHLLQVISLIFSTGSAAIEFIEKLIEIIQKNKSESVELKDSKTGKSIIKVDKDTPKSKIIDALKIPLE